ncbi:Gluconate 2-dehydrogenase subunit 3 [Nocardioides terrae]|uniref:Gluconate 2-dehydrogenase subunit 3 n=1 Tax=Nocardioides terrae TaxID=574651 RepID=A0A1I1KV17_9ACTN|nr:gluconate 2-dehydrogenase subunit 3 family protein [Nocardioides terrae]SFC64629.1 Gluconate 2-dehydrogenase subunit 3 [Nocardioides terrae]
MSDVAPGERHDRFPGFDALAQAGHWDPVTAGTVMARLGMPPDIRFFTPEEEAVGTALCDRLLGEPGEDHAKRVGRGTRVAVLNMIDARLAEKQTDGWRYDDMPHDGEAWRDTLAALDQDARDRFGHGFAACSVAEQETLIQQVQDLGSDRWHGLCARHVWSLWTRYVCTAFYSHPSAWDEMGFPGPAYPRGYKNTGVDAREPFEVRDARPGDDPARSRR